ncbi:MAG: hypothetical protein FWE57_12320, partial [Chitinispirillia bacterium]|nr:hypothetical protein [Chitinispirillia bacterium]
MIRPRVNNILSNAIKNPFAAVHAGAGCGKTQAVSDFLKKQQRPYSWVQLNNANRSAARLWENITDSITQIDTRLSNKCKGLGFPGTAEKLSLFVSFIQSALKNSSLIIVLDNFHLVKEPAVLNFVQRIINEPPPCLKMILICRDMPKVNIDTLQIKGFISEINDTDLNFTESELAEYLRHE